MLFYPLIIWCTFILLEIQFGSSENDYYALAVQRTNQEYTFAKLATTPRGEILDKYTSSISGNKRFNFLCPISHTNTLKNETYVDDSNPPPKQICESSVRPTIVRVKGTWKADDGEQLIHVYHIGFQISIKNDKNVIRFPKYEYIEQDDYILPMIALYRDEIFQYTVAAQYTIINADNKPPLQNKIYYKDVSNHKNDKIDRFYKNHCSKIQEIMGKNYKSENHELALESLVYEGDFFLDIWKQTTHYHAYQILIWFENIKIWRNIGEFIRKIASHPKSNTKVTAGIGKVLITTDDEGNEAKFEWGEGWNRVFIPELYWKAVEYSFYGSTSTTGVLIIMHNEPLTQPMKVKRICDENLCWKQGIWEPTEDYGKWSGPVYCCRMDAENLKKLGVAFLLKEREFLREVQHVPFPAK